MGSGQGKPSAQEAAASPNNILFIQNLPHETTYIMLEVLYNLCKNQIMCLCVCKIVIDLRRLYKRKIKEEPESSAELSP